MAALDSPLTVAGLVVLAADLLAQTNPVPVILGITVDRLEHRGTEAVAVVAVALALWGLEVKQPFPVRALLVVLAVISILVLPVERRAQQAEALAALEQMAAAVAVAVVLLPRQRLAGSVERAVLVQNTQLLRAGRLALAVAVVVVVGPVERALLLLVALVVFMAAVVPAVAGLMEELEPMAVLVLKALLSSSTPQPPALASQETKPLLALDPSLLP